jgi:hypothetical protein
MIVSTVATGLTARRQSPPRCARRRRRARRTAASMMLRSSSRSGLGGVGVQVDVAGGAAARPRATGTPCESGKRGAQQAHVRRQSSTSASWSPTRNGDSLKPGAMLAKSSTLRRASRSVALTSHRKRLGRRRRRRRGPRRSACRSAPSGRRRRCRAGCRRARRRRRCASEK